MFLNKLTQIQPLIFPGICGKSNNLVQPYSFKVFRHSKRLWKQVRPGTHYPHVSWAHVMLRVRSGCGRRFNIEFYGADSHFCHSAYVTWSHVAL